MIKDIGEKEGISKEDCAYINARVVKELYVSTKDVKTVFLHSIEQGKADCEMTEAITLPPFISGEQDVMGFYYPDSEPNFVTSGKVNAEVRILEEKIETEDLAGKILLIPSADPGYDWIFSHGIKGFITMYGGANSHMAIRAGELGIPAAVGVGTKAFDKYKRARVLELDALNKAIYIIK